MNDNSTYERGAALFRELNGPAFEAMTNALSEISPDLMKLAAAFPFGEIYPRDGLPKRDRQLITLASLATRGDAPNQLRVHVDIALNMGISQTEIAETFLQLAPYAGFPTAINATMVLKDALAARHANPS